MTVTMPLPLIPECGTLKIRGLKLHARPYTFFKLSSPSAAKDQTRLLAKRHEATNTFVMDQLFKVATPAAMHLRIGHAPHPPRPPPILKHPETFEDPGN